MLSNSLVLSHVLPKSLGGRNLNQEERQVLAYRTTSGRLIDLWSFPPDHLGTASHLAALIQSQTQADPLPSEEELRAKVQWIFAFIGLHRDSPPDDALGVFVLDLAARWLGRRQQATPPPDAAGSSWRNHLRARLMDALGLESWGGKSYAAKQLGLDQSSSSRFAEALASPRDATFKKRGDMLNKVEHLLELRNLRLAVEEGVPHDLVGAFGIFLCSSESDLSYRAQRLLLAVSRFVRFHLAGSDASRSGWRGFSAEQADLVWALGTRGNELFVSAVTDWLLRLLALPAVQAPIQVLPIPKEACANPDVCTAFHMGFFDASGILPVPEDPVAFYDGDPGISALNEGRFFTEEGLTDAIGRAAGGPFPSPGQRVTGPIRSGTQAKEGFAVIIKEARRMRRTFPLAVWVASGGAVTPDAQGNENVVAVLTDALTILSL